MAISLPTKLQHLPTTLPIDAVVRIELEEGILVFRASSTVQNHIEELLAKQQTAPLNPEGEQKLVHLG
jgi:uncharacterized coiled-coil DUF342 family protein